MRSGHETSTCRSSRRRCKSTSSRRARKQATICPVRVSSRWRITHLERRLRLPEGALHAPEALVRAGDVLGAQPGGRAQDKLAVEPRVPLHRRPVDGHTALVTVTKRGPWPSGRGSPARPAAPTDGRRPAPGPRPRGVGLQPRVADALHDAQPLAELGETANEVVQRAGGDQLSRRPRVAISRCRNLPRSRNDSTIWRYSRRRPVGHYA